MLLMLLLLSCCVIGISMKGKFRSLSLREERERGVWYPSTTWGSEVPLDFAPFVKNNTFSSPTALTPRQCANDGGTAPQTLCFDTHDTINEPSSILSANVV